MKVQRLGVEHYDEILGLLNEVFSRQNGKEMDFEKDLPKLAVRDEAHMRKHCGIFEDGKLVACMGVYPFETVVAGKKLLFCTMGNVVVHWDYEGRGYMSAMLEWSKQEMKNLNIDVGRLGGLRSRYNRYGFEACGMNYSFTFTGKNRAKRFPDYKGGIVFRKIVRDDQEALAFAAGLYNANAIAVTRTPQDAYLSMTAWRSTPYLALKEGKPIGYLSVGTQVGSISEVYALDCQALQDVLCGWQDRVNTTLHFQLQQHQVEELKVFSAACESFSMASPSHFFIQNWAETVDAFMKLKASYSALPQGEVKIGIENYGTIRVYVDENGAGCEKTEEAPDLELEHLAATRYLFGPCPPVCTADASLFAQSCFPLPLSWNGQDRV